MLDHSTTLVGQSLETGGGEISAKPGHYPSLAPFQGRILSSIYVSIVHC